jgi:hypothetical protein
MRVCMPHHANVACVTDISYVIRAVYPGLEGNAVRPSESVTVRAQGQRGSTPWYWAHWASTAN